MYGSHFGGDLKGMFPTLYNATLKHKKPSTQNDGVRLQNLQSINGFKFLSISKNRYFRKGKTVKTKVLLVTSKLILKISINKKKRV